MLRICSKDFCSLAMSSASTAPEEFEAAQAASSAPAARKPLFLEAGGPESLNLNVVAEPQRDASHFAYSARADAGGSAGSALLPEDRAVTVGVLGAPIGMTIAAMEAVVAAAGGPAALVDKTTRWVRDEFVLPLTEGKVTSAAHCLLEQGRIAADSVSAATVFVSHSYEYFFLDMVDALRAWEAQQPAAAGPFVYHIDPLCDYQHSHEGSDAPSIAKVIEENTARLAAVGRTVLVLKWSDPAALRRAWPLFEIATTRALKLPFSVALPAGDEAGFLHALLHDFNSLVYKTCTVRAEGGSATVDGHREQLFRRIAAHQGGQFALAQQIIATMKDWMLERCKTALAIAADGDAAKVFLMCNTARLLLEHGKPADAEATFRAALAMGKAFLPAEHAALMSCAAGLARVLQSRGQLDEAETLCKEALKIANESLGSNHPNTLTSMLPLITVLQASGRLSEAETLCRDAFERYSCTMGPDNADTLACQSQLSSILHLRGDLALSEVLYRDTASRCDRVLGPDHPLSLASSAGVTGVLLARGKVTEAAPMGAQVLLARRRVLGDAHPDTLTTLAMMARIYQALGDAAAAEAHFRQAVDGRRSVLPGGDQHPDTVVALLEYGRFLNLRCRSEEAVPLMDDASAALSSVLADASKSRTFMAALAHANKLADPGRSAASAAASSMSVRKASSDPTAPGRRGLTLAALNAIISLAGGSDVLAGKTTDWVKYNVVLPFSMIGEGAARKGYCMADALIVKEAVPASEVQPANVFVSHAYWNSFLQMVQTLAAWEAKQPPGSGPFYYYVDLMLVNQHEQVGDVPFSVLRDEFAAGVRSAGRLLLLLDWPHMQPLTRLWCIFEIATAMQVGSTFHAVMMPSQEAAFDEVLLRDFGSIVAGASATDANKAVAGRDGDRDNIRRLVEEQHPGPEGGFVRINRFVASAIRAWLTERFLWAMQRRLRGEA